MQKSGREAVRGFGCQDVPSRPLVSIESRPPQPRDPNKPSLLTLGNDIVVLMTDILEEESPGSLRSLGLVSSYYYNIAGHSRHRNVTVGQSNQKDEAMRLEHLERCGILPAIRHLTVASQVYLPTINRVSNLAPRMTGLRDVTWNEPIGTDMLRVFKSRPTARLHTSVGGYYRRAEGETPSSALGRLAGSPSLFSLNVGFTYTSAMECREMTLALKQVLLSCPNLRRLKLDLHMPRSGCCVYGPPPGYNGCGFVDGQRPPALEDLEVVAYPFGFAKRPLQEGSVTFDGHDDPGVPEYPGERDEVEYWAEVFDWSQLKRLKTSYMALSGRMMPFLTSLKTSETDRHYSDATGAVRQFYEQIPAALETIAVSTVASVGLKGIICHGKSLRELRVHKKESHRDDWRPATIDAATLVEIRKSCPGLETLALDIGRDGTWPYEILDMIASFPRLRHLTIWFELGVGSPLGTPVQPLVTFAAASALVSRIRDHAPRSPWCRLRTVEIISGAPPDMGLGYPSTAAFYPLHNSTRFVSTFSERDDEVTEGVFITTCPLLDDAQNEQLQEHARRLDLGIAEQHDAKELYLEEQDGPLARKHEAYMVARDGPFARNTWHAHY